MSEARKTLAVALRYERPQAPRVTAIGRGELAARIVDLAERSGVPLSQNPELAAVLAKVEIDQEIPVALYRAVAEVLAYVLRVAGRLPHRGTPLAPRPK
jgi:flagellar biosynthesis protein